MDLTELIQSGKVVVTRIQGDQNILGPVEEQVHCPSCDKFVKPELSTSS